MISPLSRTGLLTTIPEHPERQKYVCVLKAFDGYSKRVVHTRQEAIGGTGTLADTHEGKPGLPRGRSRLPAPAVQASQRERLLRAVVAAVAASDYAVVTVADIVKRARVSRAAFYTHFTDKEDCFLAAAREGGRLMDQRIVAATRAAAPGTPDEAVLRVAVRGFLAFVTGEPEFAKIFYIDMPAAGPVAVDQLARAQHRYADLNQTWHERARTRHPGWPARLPYDAYLALAGATAELVRTRVRAGQISAIPVLEDTLVALHLAVMTGQPWPAGPSGVRSAERSAY
jgi:AcrR family transcriptional regulator